MAQKAFADVLKASGYHVTDTEFKCFNSLNHLEELRPFMDWFTDFIQSDNCLTPDELRMFEELEDEGKILYGEDLENALDECFEENAPFFQDVMEDSDLQFLEEKAVDAEDALQNLRTLKDFLIKKLDNAKEVINIKSEEKRVSKTMSQIVASLFELNLGLNDMLSALSATWTELKKPLIEFNNPAYNKNFFSSQSLRPYNLEASKFDVNLANYVKYKFNKRIKFSMNSTFSCIQELTSTFTKDSASPAKSSLYPESNYSQIKCKKLSKQLECVQEHIKRNREEKTLALADEKAYSLALKQMNCLIESFNNGLKLSVTEVRMQTLNNTEKLVNQEENLCELTQSLSLDCEKLSEYESLKAISGEQVVRLKRCETKMNHLHQLSDFIEKRLHVDEYLWLFLKNELLKISALIDLMENIVESASSECGEIRNNTQNLVTQEEDFLKKQAIQQCKAHPLISTLNGLYKLKCDDPNDLTRIIYTIEVQNKIISDVSYQLTRMYNLDDPNSADSLSYMRQLTDSILLGKSRRPVSSIDKSMVPVQKVDKQMKEMESLLTEQKFRLKDHIEYLAKSPSPRTLWSLLLERNFVKPIKKEEQESSVIVKSIKEEQESF